MTRAVQQVLTALLLLIFLSEHVALASVLNLEGEASLHRQSSFVQHEIQVLGSFLAEQNEERDWRDDVAVSVRRDGVAVRLMSMHSQDPLHCWYYPCPTRRAIPMYTYYCTYLI